MSFIKNVNLCNNYINPDINSFMTLELYLVYVELFGKMKRNAAEYLVQSDKKYL